MPVTAQQAALGKSDVVAYVGQNASRFGIDPAAILAVANQEGLNHGPDSGKGLIWYLPGEGGSYNFGPPSWNSGWAGNPAAGTPIVQAHGNEAPAWSWTPAGLDYWMEQVSHVAGGLRGDAAITAIVTNFERPAARNVGPEIQSAHNIYNQFLQQIQGSLDGSDTTTVPNPGSGQFPVTTNPEDKSQSTATSPFSFKLFDTPLGPINFDLPWDPSGVILFLAAIFAIIIGVLLWDKTRNVIVKGGEAAGQVAAVAA